MTILHTRWENIISVRTTKNTQRLTELDVLRGIALVLMVYFHLIWSMHELFGYQVFYSSWINFYIGKISAILFILISGIVFSFSSSWVKRFVLLASISMGITIVTYLFDPTAFVKFGILHFLALSSLVALLFQNIHKYLLLLIWIAILLTWFLIPYVHVQSDVLFFLWFVSPSFQSTDYYPLLPRFGIYLIGMGLAKILYVSRKNLLWSLLDFAPLQFVGRNTLLIYLIHQPIIILVLYMISLVSKYN
jgi:uncharacterized membrane protein